MPEAKRPFQSEEPALRRSRSCLAGLSARILHMGRQKGHSSLGLFIHEQIIFIHSTEFKVFAREAVK